MLLGADDSLQTNLVCVDEIHKNAKQEKVLGVTLNNKLNFATHLLSITKIPARRLMHQRGFKNT